MKQLAGKVALVTGASRGIGLAIAEDFAAAGANIALHGRTIDTSLQARCDAISNRYNVRAFPVSGDLSFDASIDAMFAQFDQFAGGLDILVNNAGFETAFSLETMPLEDWEAVLKVNLTAPFRCSQLAYPRMKKAGGGVIVNISSIHDEVPRKGFSHYSIAKAGLKMLTRCAAVEWAEVGIRVVTISPGAIETDINRDVIDSIGRSTFNEWIPLGVGVTADVAKLVTFISSNDARYITGTELYVDGGYMRNLVRYDGRPKPNKISQDF